MSRESTTSRRPRRASHSQAKLFAPSTRGKAWERAIAPAAARRAPKSRKGSSVLPAPERLSTRRASPVPVRRARRLGHRRRQTVVPVMALARATSGVTTIASQRLTRR
jgi:hypothetical protein